MKNSFEVYAAILLVALVASVAMCGSRPMPDTHWPDCPPTSIFNASMIVTIDASVDRSGALVGVFSESGECYGQGMLTGSNMNIPIRGNDPITAEKDGADEGEEVFLIFYDEEQVNYTLESGNVLTYSDDAIFVVTSISYGDAAQMALILAERDSLLNVSVGMQLQIATLTAQNSALSVDLTDALEKLTDIQSILNQ